MAIDNKQATVFKRMAPYTGLMDLTVPYKVSNNPTTSVPVLSTLNHMLEVRERECTPWSS